MPRFTVNCSITFMGWLDVVADTADEAFELAQGMDASEVEFDSSTGEVAFNVSPQVSDESGAEA